MKNKPNEKSGHYTCYIMILVLGFIVAFLAIQNYKAKVDNQGIQTQLDLTTIQQDEYIQNYSYLLTSLIGSTGSMFNANSMLVDRKGDTTSFGKLITKTPKIVFVFGEKNCQVCVDKVLSCMSKMEKAIAKQNCYIIGNFRKNRDLQILKQSKKIHSEAFQLVNDDLGICTNVNNNPYIFAISSLGTVDFVIPILKNSDFITECIFNAIASNYFSE